ncbi:MAG: carbohydrate ABC transporter permease [Treponema sp.]|nr:carbohydrate ABC transporter permease [Treponema sp.]
MKDLKEVYTFPIQYFPKKPSFASYTKLFSFARFGVYFRNSLILTLTASFGALVFAVLSGFGLSRIGKRSLKQRLLLLLYFTQMVPPFIIMTPLYTTFSSMGASDSMIIVAIIYVSIVLAFSVIMAKSFFDRIPIEIDEAARVDGCSVFQSLVWVIIPVMRSGLAAIFCFAFVNIWNELFVAVLFLNSPNHLTIPVALNSFISKAGISWDILSAGIVVALLPTMLVFAFGQRYIVAGLTEGSVKG